MNIKSADAIKFFEKKYGPYHFGISIVGMRVNADLSQTQLAKKLKISRGTLCDIEKGRQPVSIKLALKIAKIAGFPEKMVIQEWMQDQLERVNLKYKVKLTA
jgi:DNA-binding XRE family transcriptional regulator